MSEFRIVCTWLLCALNIAFGSGNLKADPGRPRSWQPLDSVALSYFSDSNYASTNAVESPVFSPVQVGDDGHYVFVISHHGDISTDKKVITVRVWDVSVIKATMLQPFGSIKPFREFHFHSPNNNSTLGESVPPVTFADHGRSIIYIGQDELNISNAYKFDIKKGHTSQLTRSSRNIISYCYDNDSVAFVSTGERPNSISNYPIEEVQTFIEDEYSDRVGSTATDRKLLAIRPRGDVLRSNMDDVYMVSGSGSTYRITSTKNGNYTLRAGSCAVSGNGRKSAIVIYNDQTSTETIVTDLSTGLVIFKRQTSGQPPQYHWSPDETRLLAMSYDIRLGKNMVSIITPGSNGSHSEIILSESDGIAPLQARWLDDDSIYVLAGANGGSESASIFRRTNAEWLPEKAGIIGPSLTADAVRFDIDQNINQPAVLVATYRGKKLQLTQPDPLLTKVWRAKSKEIQWDEGNERTGRGGLLLPRDYETGSRVPLVIQDYWYWPDVFLPDGPHPGTVDSAQALVARGIAVLQVGPRNVAEMLSVAGKPAELEQVRIRTDAIIRELDRRGIIDPNRVGMTGFSRGGLHVYHAITHPGKYPLAAAIADDSNEGSFTGMLINGSPASAHSEEVLYGTNFWKDPAPWLQYEQTFNIHRVRTPFLFTNHIAKSEVQDDPSYPAAGLAKFNAFLINRKPVDWAIFPDALHNLQRPQQIVAMQQLVVDWMAFWLKGYVPTNRDRAARWIELRKRQQGVLDDLAAKGEKVTPLPTLVEPTAAVN